MSLIIFFVIFIMLWLLIEIIAIIMKLTGLELSKARFQIISILTHTGFTSRESELIVQHPTRRKIASVLMVVSYVAQITLITLLFDVLNNATKSLLSISIVLTVVLVLIVVATQLESFSKRFDRFAERLLKNKIKKINSNNRIDQILNLSPEFSIFELIVDTESFICKKTLRELHLKEHYIQVLKIDRGSEMIDFPLADTQILSGDRMIVYGKIEALTKLIFHDNEVPSAT